MTYTRGWSTIIPANADAASGAASDMRNIRVDIEERMDTLLGAGEWAKDPIEVFLADQFLMYHWSDFAVLTSSGGTWGASAGTLYGVTNGTLNTGVLYCPCLLPRGVTVTSIELLGQTGAGGSITATLESIDATTGTITQSTHATASMAASVTQSAVVSPTVAITIDATLTNYKFYYLKISFTAGSSNSWFQGVRVNYTRGGLGQTI